MSQALTMPPTTSQESRDNSLMSLSFAAFMVAIGLFIASLFFPVFITQAHDIYGYWVLVMGWLGFITFQFAWYATPFALLAIHVSRKSPQLGLFLSIVAIIMASEAFLFTEVPFGKGDKVLDYDLGFYLWYSCFYLVSFSILLRLVAWGSIEDDAQPIEVHREEVIETTSLQETFAAELATVKAKRKIVSKHMPVAERELDTEQYKLVKLPPVLPKKNVYKIKEVLTPPPLPLTKKNSQVKSAKPPSLPSLKIENIPPPLPVKSLKITPFFSVH